MNRYAAAGLIHEAMNDKAVIVLSPNASMSVDAMNAVVSALGEVDPDAYRVRRTNGEQRVEFAWGGRICFGSVRTSLRGISADIVFIDQGADQTLSATERERLHSDLGGVLALGGEVITA